MPPAPKLSRRWLQFGVRANLIGLPEALRAVQIGIKKTRKHEKDEDSLTGLLPFSRFRAFAISSMASRTEGRAS